MEHLWLITTSAAKADAECVRDQVHARHPAVQIHEFEYLDDKDSIRESKEKVESLRRLAMKTHRVSQADVICDFTGLTKGASAGMILACAPRDARLQYMVPKVVTAEGRADTTAGIASEPREVDIRYTVIEEPEA